MPGHTNAALVELRGAELRFGGARRRTRASGGLQRAVHAEGHRLRFIDDVAREVAALSAGPYLHIGGDEVHTMPHDEYVAFMERVQPIVAATGQQMVGWGEIATADLPASVIVQHWSPTPPRWRWRAARG